MSPVVLSHMSNVLLCVWLILQSMLWAFTLTFVEECIPKILLVLYLHCCTHMTCWMWEALNHIKCFPFLFHVWRCTKIHWEIILNVLSSIILKFNVKWTLHIHFSARWKCKWGLLHLNLSCHYVSSYQMKMKWHFAFPFRQIFSQACFVKSAIKCGGQNITAKMYQGEAAMSGIWAGLS